MQQQDVIVLGAGIVGVSAALHLQARGRSVVLLGPVGPKLRFWPTQGTDRERLIYKVSELAP